MEQNILCQRHLKGYSSNALSPRTRRRFSYHRDKFIWIGDRRHDGALEIGVERGPTSPQPFPNTHNMTILFK
jgi:hypothetical protein